MQQYLLPITYSDTYTGDSYVIASFDGQDNLISILDLRDLAKVPCGSGLRATRDASSIFNEAIQFVKHSTSKAYLAYRAKTELTHMQFLDRNPDRETVKAFKALEVACLRLAVLAYSDHLKLSKKAY